MRLDLFSSFWATIAADIPLCLHDHHFHQAILKAAFDVVANSHQAEGKADPTKFDGVPLTSIL